MSLMEPSAAPALAPITARDAGLVACMTCGLVHERPEAQDGKAQDRKAQDREARCARCGARLRSRRPHSLQRALAWAIAGGAVYIPSLLTPMVYTERLGSRVGDTIVSGVLALAQNGDLFVAVVVFVASIVVPVSKIAVILGILTSVVRGARLRKRWRLRLYRTVEFIGRWSMIDVFVVAVLAALVQLGAIATVTPGPAAAPFALSVIFTMFAANAIDTRLIWDRARDREDARDGKGEQGA